MPAAVAPPPPYAVAPHPTSCAGTPSYAGPPSCADPNSSAAATSPPAAVSPPPSTADAASAYTSTDLIFPHAAAALSAEVITI